jgi:hypothetical protein
VPRPLQNLRGSAPHRSDDTVDERLEALANSFDRLLTGVRRQAPQATVVLVDYLVLLPPCAWGGKPRSRSAGAT